MRKLMGLTPDDAHRSPTPLAAALLAHTHIRLARLNRQGWNEALTAAAQPGRLSMDAVAPTALMLNRNYGKP